MSFANVVLYVALIAFVLYGKAKGWPMKPPKRLFLLPIVIVVIGYGDLNHGAMKPLAVTLTVIGGAISLGLGLLRGRADKVSIRNGSQYVQWGVMSFVLFASNIAAKLALDLIGVAAGDTFSAVGKSLIFTLGLTLVGEAIVLWLRSSGATVTRSANRVSPGGGRQSGYDTPPGSSPSLRDGALNWIHQQVDQPARTDRGRTAPSPILSDDENDRHHHDHHHHDHHRGSNDSY